MKNVLYLAVVSSLLFMSTLLLGGCSKGLNDSEIETSAGNRTVYLKFINKSGYQNQDLTFHFDPESSHCGHYSIGCGEGSDFHWGQISYPINEQNMHFDRLNNDVKERNLPHVLFWGSGISTWHQDIIVSLRGSDQEKFQIKGTAAANNANEINIWLNRWSNNEKYINLECSRVEVGKDKFDDWSVYIDITVNKK